VSITYHFKRENSVVNHTVKAKITTQFGNACDVDVCSQILIIHSAAKGSLNFCRIYNL